MSLIIKTEAIVLRAIKYSETSKIVTFYTKELGKIGAIVKGARKRESKVGSALEPMSYVQVVLYVKESREVQLVSQIELIQSFHHIASDLERISVGLSLVEIVNAIVHEQEQNVPLFLLLKDSLSELENLSLSPSFLLWYFELKLSELLGFAPVFDSCGKCKKALTTDAGTSWQLYSISRGSPVCNTCSVTQETLTHLSTNAVQALGKLISIPDVKKLNNNYLEVQKNEEIETFLTKYLQLHVPGFRIPRSREMLKAVS
ncbi:MAG: DNA repair protein RecO [Bacteroidetes bacterium]|nr:MAG: DNA repair protein RecO [Bacteroidota bacterium]